MKPTTAREMAETLSSRLLLTPEEDAEFRRIGQTRIGDITQKDLIRYSELVKKVLDAITAEIESEGK